jgi:AraC-like DNA-binding protein/mannose-6-phosphate isomerase-like protein (cupin superfamily)
LNQSHNGSSTITPHRWRPSLAQTLVTCLPKFAKIDKKYAGMANPPHLHRVLDRSSSEIFFWKAEDSGRWHTESHLHEQGQLFSLDSGTASMEVKGASWLLLPGRVGWIPPHHRHSMTSNGSISGWSLYIPADQAAVLPDHPLIFMRSGLVEHIVARIGHLKESNTSGEALGRLLAVLSDEMTLSPADTLALPLPQDQRLHRLVGAFTQDPAIQYDLDHWAKEVGMSKRSLTRSFQAETGMSVGQWIQKFRILSATKKLAAGHDVTSVALSCGYGSVSAFIRSFHLNAGTTPAKYRREALDEARVISKRAAIRSDYKADSEL